MGADRAIHVEIPEPQSNTLEPLGVAKIFSKLAKEEDVNLIIVGKQV